METIVNYILVFVGISSTAASKTALLLDLYYTIVPMRKSANEFPVE